MKRTILVAIAVLAITVLSARQAAAQYFGYSGRNVQVRVNVGGYPYGHSYQHHVCPHPPVVVNPHVYRPPHVAVPYYSPGDIARANAEARRNLHDAHNQQERMQRDMHKAQREQLERQIRMTPPGSFARKRLTQDLIDLRRAQARAEDDLDDYNDELRRQFYQMQKR